MKMNKKSLYSIATFFLILCAISIFNENENHSTLFIIIIMCMYNCTIHIKESIDHIQESIKKLKLDNISNKE